jgi:hypothetical protein
MNLVPLCLALNEFFPEMPRKYEVIIWIHGPGFFLGYDRNFGADRVGPNLFRIPVGGACDHAAVYSHH